MTTQHNPLVSPPSILLEGDSGSGKTDVLLSLVEAGLELFVVITEPNGLDSLFISAERRGISMDKVHYKILAPANMGMKSLIEQTKKINQLDFANLTKMSGGIDKHLCTQYIDLLSTIQNFKCDRTGEEFGDVTEWGPDRAFVVDSFTGMMEMIVQNTIGLRPMIQLAEYGVIQNVGKALLDVLCSCNCFFVLTCHIERIRDEVTGAMKIMPMGVGQKLSPKLPIFFSEVVLCNKDGNTFLWSNASKDVVSKARALPLGTQLKPSFVPIVDAYNKRVEQAKGDKVETK